MVARTVAALFAVLVLLVTSSAPLAAVTGNPKPIVLLYHGPTKQYGEALAALLNEDDRLRDAARVVLTDDQELMKTLLYFPQVKIAIIVATQYESNLQKMTTALRWFFSQGGGLVGLGGVGLNTTGRDLTEDVFPLFGNWYQKGKSEAVMLPNGTRRIKTKVTYGRDETIEEINGDMPEEFSLDDKRFVTYLDSNGQVIARRPALGDYRVLYRDSVLGAPLVVAYTANGTSVTFAGTDQISEEPGDNYYGKILGDPTFRKLLANSIYYVWSHESRYQSAMDKAANVLDQMARTKDELEQEINAGERRQGWRRMVDLAILAALGAGLIGGISYYCFIVPRRATPKVGGTEPG